MRFKPTTVIAGILAICMTSCSTDREQGRINPDDKVAVTVKAGLTTRAQDTEWDVNDAIGITMLEKNGQQIIGSDFNREYVTNAPLGTFKPSNYSNTIYFPQDGRDVTFIAYYPFSSTLGTDMKYKISTAEQTALPLIDFMTAVHESGTSKGSPDVNMRFYHRMSKLIFDFSENDESVFGPFSDIKVTIKGMYTSGTYDMFNESWDYDLGTVQDMTFPLRSNSAQRYGIVLPRNAGAGVTIDFTLPDGGVYTAKMSETLEIEKGKRYTFYVNLNKTEAEITATVEDWTDAPDNTFDALIVSTDLGPSEGVEIGDVMKVYLNENEQYNQIGTFTYEDDERWHAQTPVYWEDIEANPARFRASIVAAQKLHPYQIDDILVADELSVERNKGAKFVFRHSGSKVSVVLRSNTFSGPQLNSAVITLPRYTTGATEQSGQLINGTETRDIPILRDDPQTSYAIIQPQTINSGSTIVNVNINGRDYPAVAQQAFEYVAGTAYRMIVNVEMVGTTFSAEVIDWTNATVNLDAITVGTPSYGATNVNEGEEMVVYTGDASSRDTLTTFTWQNNQWSANPVVYWESLPDRATFYASILRSTKYNNTQLDDYLIAEPVTQTASNGVDFTLKHPAAKVAIQLESDGSFTDTELQAMTITLPGYDFGAYYDKGQFYYGNSTQDIQVAKNIEGANNAIAIIQPQTIPAGNTVVNLQSSNRTYTVKSDSPITFEPGVATVLKVRMLKTGMTVSANVVDWEAGDTINLTHEPLAISGEMLDDTGDFFRGKTIYLYTLNQDQSVTRYEYSYKQYQDGYRWEGDPIYWNDLPGQNLNVTAVHYPYTFFTPTLDPTQRQFPWNLQPNQKDGYQDYDLIMSHVEKAKPEYVNFVFKHVLSRVRVVIETTYFDDDELENLELILNGFKLNGTAMLTSGTINTIQTVTNGLIPHTDRNGYEYSALVMPQTILNGTDILTLELPGYPNQLFKGTIDKDLLFEAGKTTVITLTLNKTAVSITAKLEDWGEGDKGGITIE